MNDSVTLTLANADIRSRAKRWIDEAPNDVRVTFAKPLRSLDQNALMWSLLEDVAAQVPWAGKPRTKEAWKDIFTAALLSVEHELDVVPGINGGFVLLGLHTSRLSKGRMNDLITLIQAFGAEHDVSFKETASANVRAMEKLR